MAAGGYTAIFVLYEVNELGSYSDMDRVEHGLNFEIIDNEDAGNINWTHR